MYKVVYIEERKTGNLILCYQVFDKKLFDKILKKLKKNKFINIRVEDYDEWF